MVDYLAFAKAHPERFVNPPEGGFTILLGEDEIREVEAFMAQKLQAKGLPTEWSRVGIVYKDRCSSSAIFAMKSAIGSLKSPRDSAYLVCPVKKVSA